MAGYFLNGLVILHALSGIPGMLDITCRIRYARIDINGDNGLDIGGYMSRDDAGANVTFGREADTGTGNGLPSGSIQRNHLERARTLYMPTTGGVQRIGGFYCEAQKDSIETRIPAIIMASNSVVTPQWISQTVNVGDDVTLSVITDTVNTRWRLNGSSEIGEWNDLKSVQRSTVQASHGGIYECYKAGNRAEGRHAIFLLVVRACTSRKWGLPACDNDCHLCFNGGICDERSGICVCAPGFTGIHCETVHGSNILGQDVSWHCGTGTPDSHSTACRGRLFCLPHPYGCSCAAGLHGIDCDQDCQLGTYGANCESVCHCAEGVSCLPDTGECRDGQCHSDWFGVNCQYRCHCAEGVACLPDTGCSDGRCHKAWYGFKCQERCQEPAPVNEFLVSQTSSPYELTVSLEMIEGQCIADGYIIRYTLINQDQCNEEIEETIKMETSDRVVILNNLYPFSTYRVSSSAVNSAGEGMETFMIQTTYIAEPSLAPSNISESEVGLTMLSMQWMEPPCGSRHGTLSYQYHLKNKADAVVMTDVTQSTNITMTDLEPLTHYTFQVAAVTDAGSGPWSGVYNTSTKGIMAPAKLPDIEDAHVFATVRIIIPQSTEELVTDYQVGVQIREMKPKKQMNDFGHYIDSKEAYVTAELSKNDVLQSPVFLVGDGQMYGKYYNAPLKANQTYTLHVAYVVRINTTVFEAYWSEGTDATTPSSTYTCNSSKHRSSSISAAATTMIAVLVTVIVILTLIIGIMSFILRAKNKQVKQQRRDKTKSTPLRALASNTGAPSQLIEMSLDGYVEYKPNSSESTYQGTSEVDRPTGQEDTYEEIPASTYATTIVCADDGEQEEDDVYTNDTVIKHRAPKLLPQYQPGE